MSGPTPEQWARNRYGHYCRYMRPGYVRGRHLDILCAKLDDVAKGRIKRLIVEMPPRHSKTEHIGRLFPPYFLGRYPSKKVMYATHSASIATDVGRDVRDYILDDSYQSVFPGVTCRSDSKAANKFHIERPGMRKPENGFFITISRDGRKSGRGADLLLIDDLLDEMETYSDAKKEAARRAMRGLRTRLQPNAAIILLMNRVGDDDPIAYAKEAWAHEGWEVVGFSAVAEEREEWNLPDGSQWIRQPGDALWPEMYDAAALDALRLTMPVHEWSAKFQRRPIPMGGKMVDEEWFAERRYDDEPAEILRTAQRITLTADTSKGTATGARSALGLIAENERGAFLLRVWAERWQMPLLIEHSKQAAMQGEPHAVLIEDKSTGESLIQILRAEQAGTLKPQPGQVRWRWPIVDIRPTQDKLVRFAACTPALKDGALWLPSRHNSHTSDWLPKFEAEFFRYPNTELKDQGDMISQFLNWRRENPLEGIKGPKGFGQMSEALSKAYSQDDIAAW